MKKNSNHLMSNAVRLIETMDLTIVQNCTVLKVWEQAQYIIPKHHEILLEEARLELIEFWNLWNEEEIKMNFVSPVLRVSKVFEKTKCRRFMSEKWQEWRVGMSFLSFATV